MTVLDGSRGVIPEAPVIDTPNASLRDRVTRMRGDICRRELLVEIEAFRQF
jgi:hypothetical protein